MGLSSDPVVSVTFHFAQIVKKFKAILFYSVWRQYTLQLWNILDRALCKNPRMAHRSRSARGRVHFVTTWRWPWQA